MRDNTQTAVLTTFGLSIALCVGILTLELWQQSQLTSDVAYCRDQLVSTLKSPSSFRMLEVSVSDRKISDNKFVEALAGFKPYKFWSGNNEGLEADFEATLEMYKAKRNLARRQVELDKGPGPFRRQIRIAYEAQNAFGVFLRSVHGCDYVLLDQTQPVPIQYLTAEADAEAQRDYWELMKVWNG